MKKHYVEIADLIKALDVDKDTKIKIGILFESFFTNDNSNFDSEEWWDTIRDLEEEEVER